jgi:thioredoxin-like negative regulator of GroEL
MMIIVYIFIGIITLFMVMQFNMIRLAKKSKGIKLSGLQGELKILEKKDTRGLVYFFSPSCHACKTQTPVIRDMKADYKNIFDIDISKDFQTAKIFGIKATPTTITVEDGMVNNVYLGAKPKEFLEGLMNNFKLSTVN